MKIIKPGFCGVVLLLYLVCNTCVYAQDTSSGEQAVKPEKTVVPLSRIFYNIGGNALHSLTFNYGANFAAAGLGTWLFIESGVDWAWRNFGYDHEPLANAAFAATIYAGWAIPFVAPVGFYAAGLFKHDEKLQLTAMALVQSLALANAVHVTLKLSTGRSVPYLVNQYHHQRRSISDDFSGDFDWFNMVILDGWPSGHTFSAFAVAATLAQMYRDNPWVKIAAYSYAVLVGAGMSLSVHWASDVLAGALMGYAIGTTVGRSFSQLIKPAVQNSTVSFSITAQPLGVMIRF